MKRLKKLWRREIRMKRWKKVKQLKFHLRDHNNTLTFISLEYKSGSSNLEEITYSTGCSWSWISQGICLSYSQDGEESERKELSKKLLSTLWGKLLVNLRASLNKRLVAGGVTRISSRRNSGSSNWWEAIMLQSISKTILFPSLMTKWTSLPIFKQVQ